MSQKQPYDRETFHKLHAAIKQQRLEYKEALHALCGMWNQYCGEDGHWFMSAGERTAKLLIKKGLLKDEWSTIPSSVEDELLPPEYFIHKQQ